MYYANINSKGQLIGIGKCMLDTDEFESTNVQNIEVSEEYYNNYIQYGEDYYTCQEGEIVLNPEYETKKLQETKENKIIENNIARDEALMKGILYNNIIFDSDTDQKANILGAVLQMSDTDTIPWFGMNNDCLICTKQDLLNIGGLITTLHSFVWNRNAEIKTAINEAQTIEEINNIEIDYSEEAL